MYSICNYNLHVCTVLKQPVKLVLKLTKRLPYGNTNPVMVTVRVKVKLNVSPLKLTRVFGDVDRQREL